MQRGLAGVQRTGVLQGGPGSAQGAFDDAKRRFDGGGRRVLMRDGRLAAALRYELRVGSGAGAEREPAELQS